MYWAKNRTSVCIKSEKQPSEEGILRIDNPKFSKGSKPYFTYKIILSDVLSQTSYNGFYFW